MDSKNSALDGKRILVYKLITVWYLKVIWVITLDRWIISTYQFEHQKLYLTYIQYFLVNKQLIINGLKKLNIIDYKNFNPQTSCFIIP